MRAVLQKVTQANLVIVNDENKKPFSAIDAGLVVLLGVEKNDNQEDADYIVNKIINLRIFADSDDKMNLSLADTGGAVLLVSQFTLLADSKKGRRPSFSRAETPDKANALYEYCAHALEAAGITTARGRFQSHMQITLTNDGPVTLILDSRQP